jgi:hypothetical protein
MVATAKPEMVGEKGEREEIAGDFESISNDMIRPIAAKDAVFRAPFLSRRAPAYGMTKLLASVPTM